MSGIVAIHDRSGAPLEPEALDRAMGRLAHRGPDGSDTVRLGHVALGHRHFWTLPEEVGERQPLALPDTPFTIVFDGRLDNREELLRGLDLGGEEGRRLSDAALALRAFARWGEGCLPRFLGEFALAVHDARSGDLFCARDPLGDRTLFLSRRGTRTLVASEPWAITAAGRPGENLDEIAAAHHFAFEIPADGRTLFADVRELLPGRYLVIGTSGERTVRYWEPDLSRRLRGRSDEEYAEAFRALLAESVRCRLRASTPVGVLMSGGLDSGSVACLAAAERPGERLTTLSYVFDELTECDERSYIAEIEKMWGIRSIQIPCDGLWPLRGWPAAWPRVANEPEGNPYRLLKEAAYGRAREEGLRVLLMGAAGDALYRRGSEWLPDLVAEGRFGDLGREVEYAVAWAGVGGFLRSVPARRLARRLVDRLPGGQWLRRPWSPPEWLTSRAADHLRQAKEARRDVGSPLNEDLIGLHAAWSASAEIPNAGRHALALRDPYRDRRLVELTLALPANQLYRLGRYKLVLRNAMRGVLPEAIRARSGPTSLGPLFDRGLERESRRLRAVFETPDGRWRSFIRAGWMAGRWSRPVAIGGDGPEAVLPWQCAAFEAWISDMIPMQAPPGSRS